MGAIGCVDELQDLSMDIPFLSLVKLGIGKPVHNLPQSFDWPSIHTLAVEQGLSAIVMDGIERLPEQLRPPKELTLQWIGEVLQSYEYRYSDYAKAIGELAAFYSKHGIKLMILKGYGLGLNYPIAKHRPCGDIDTWNFGRQEEADAVLTKELGIPVDTSEHHHTVFSWKGYMVENHYDMLITTATKANGQLEPVLKDLAMNDTNSIKINGNVVYLPSANFNALFLLRHTLMHFVACGMNIRNILDWGFFWEKEGDKVDKQWVKDVAEDYHMSVFLNIINAICVDDLGFDANIFPCVQFIPDMKERVLNDTLFPEYDWTEAHKRSLIPRLIFKYKRWKAASWKRELCYGESDWESFWTSVKSHLLKPSSI